MNTATLQETIKMIVALSNEERKRLTDWLLEQNYDQELSRFSYLTSHTVLEKEWINKDEDKAWEGL